MKTPVLLFTSLILSLASLASAQPKDRSSWTKRLTSSLKAIEKKFPEASFGVYLKNLKTDQELSVRGEDVWYIASGTKVPVALAVYQAVDAGRLRLTTKATVLKSDYIDGAGELNYLKPGSKVSLRLLLDQSLTFSDNTATDILIRLVGLDRINALVQESSKNGFHPITSLSEVRRQVYGEVHPEAGRLSNMDYVRLKTLKTDEERRLYLAKRLGLKTEDFPESFDAAYEAYYTRRLNSATLKAYGALLEKLAEGSLLKPASQKRLLETMERSETGHLRLKAGFPENYIFAHKTGTQNRRFCDMGILTRSQDPSEKVVLVACVKNAKLDIAEQVFSRIGKAIHQAGVFPKEKK